MRARPVVTVGAMNFSVCLSDFACFFTDVGILFQHFTGTAFVEFSATSRLVCARIQTNQVECLLHDAVVITWSKFA